MRGNFRLAIDRSFLLKGAGRIVTGTVFSGQVAVGDEMLDEKTFLGVVEKAGTPIARDGDHTWVAPYDDTVLVMPGLSNLKPGNTQVRLGRFED